MPLDRGKRARIPPPQGKPVVQPSAGGERGPGAYASDEGEPEEDRAAAGGDFDGEALPGGRSPRGGSRKALAEEAQAVREGRQQDGLKREAEAPTSFCCCLFFSMEPS